MGYFFREVDFSQDVDNAEVCNLKIDSIYRWNKGSWSAICGDLFIYVTLNNNELWVGKSEVELEEPKMSLVGTYKRKKQLKTQSDFKKEMKKYFSLSFKDREKYNTPLVSTKEICKYMGWKVDDEQIGDWVEND